MDKKVPIPFDMLGIVLVEMDRVGVEREGRETK